MSAPDYAAIWRESFKDGNGSMNYYRLEDAAQAYDASENIWRDGYARAAQLPCHAGDSILDIGCGPGILSIPLAEKGCHVTVVDPSSAMLRFLSRHCQEKGLSVTQICSTWEDAAFSDGTVFDYVIASYSLGMPDIEMALKKMDALARKRVYVYWFSGCTGWERVTTDLLPITGRGEQPYRPKADILYGVLTTAGISPDLHWLQGTSFNRTFPDRRGALLDVRKRLGVSDDRFDEIIEHYLDSGGVYCETETGWMYKDSTCYVCLSWHPTGGSWGSRSRWEI